MILFKTNSFSPSDIINRKKLTKDATTEYNEYRNYL